MAAPPASHADTCIREPDETTQPNHHAERIETNGIHALGNGIINSGLDSPRATHDTQRLSPDNQDDDFAALEGITEAWWTTGAHVISAHLIEDVDENVKALLPEGSVIVSIEPHGNSTWSRTAEIQTELEGESASYFIKVTDYRSGAVMYQSEFESLKAIDQAVPGFCPKPIGWGRYAADPAVHFLLCSFIEMIDEPPDQVLLPQRLAELHQKAVAPDLKYGWHVPMASGQLPLTLAKSHSWEFIFTQYMRFLFRAEEIAQGPRPKVMERLVTALFDRIIPRLVRPLETGGRDIIPRLLHTDFWDGNVSVDEQGLPVTFDPCSMYGHNECTSLDRESNSGLAHHLQ
ncbi:Fructosamine kinase-domain-containing protein [Xylariaceae sp. FL1019]|nr:Fructosamine kinase-domain-containing protein [Xylariaceae sp. FL1019]